MRLLGIVNVASTPRPANNGMQPRPLGANLKVTNCLAYCFKTYFHPSPNKALHRMAIPARSLTQAQLALHVEQGRQVGNFAQGNLPAQVHRLAQSVQHHAHAVFGNAAVGAE